MTAACQDSSGLVNDSLLTAFAQNGALRLHCDRALVALIQDASPRISAEAGQSTLLCSLNDHAASPQQAQQQALLDRIQSIAVFQGLEPSTHEPINVIADHTRHIIHDLSVLDSYQDGVPSDTSSTRVSYAAVPITSTTGQLLGVFCAIDNKLRHEFADQDTYTVMNDIAGAISRHLESQRTQLERDHDRKAKLALARFLEHNRPQPTSSVGLPEHLPSLSTNNGISSPTTSSSGSVSMDKSLEETLSSVANTPLTTPADDSSRSGFFDPLPVPTTNPCSLDQGHPLQSPGEYSVSDSRPSDQTLSIATSLIRAAHDLEGLVLLNTTPSSSDNIFQSTDERTAGQPSLCEALETSIVTSDDTPARMMSSISVEHETLVRLISHFPQGCILKLDNCNISVLLLNTSGSGPATYEKLDGSVVIGLDLHSLLERAQSLVFMPVWDSARRAFYAAMLGWPTDPSRMFTEQDLLSLSIYGRILTADISRLDAIDTEATKSDFVSSLSHELRSPLHGCLAAVEVLRDTELDKTQIDLLGMIESCASTLLYTMNHLLDYSKINDLDRIQPTSRQESLESMSLDLPRNRFGTVVEDYLCRVVQDTVEGIAYGHDREQAAYESDLSNSPQDRILQLNRNDVLAKNKNVAVFLFMESHAAWFSMVSAGAWKRLVMNLFGNSLKFCPYGHIEVTLNMVSDPKNADKRLAHLMVSDTGVGMSENFMKHSLYRPFVQENSLVSGTGLGLNIVKQIVNDLQGTISVKSTLGVGTRFDVLIPVVERVAIPGEIVLDGGEMLDQEANLKGRTICLLSSPRTPIEDTDELHERTNLIHSYVKAIAEKWFNMKVVYAEMTEEVDADIWIAEASDYSIYACSAGESLRTANTQRTILVGNQRQLLQSREQCPHGFSELNYPLGPRVLARALHAVLRMPTNQASHKDTMSNTFSSQDQTLENPKTESVDQQTTTNSTKPPVKDTTDEADQTEHLLLVDDNAINLKLLSTFMKKLSISAHTAVDGEDAFSTYKNFASTQPVTTILMDISMPKMNGFESSRAIRDFEAKNNLLRSRIIALTALGSEASRREAEASGIDEYQMKPVAFKTLKGLFKSAPPVKIERPQEAFAKM
ncbi:hypothetical protein KCU64_g431, partial [Aureobasidium melanogenum]